MQNLWVRLNAVTFFSLSVLLGLATMCCMSTYFHEGQATVQTLKLNSIRSLRNHDGIDRALFSFDLKADLTPAWHWNSHILFVFVVAEYESEANVLNQVVIWDKIVRSKKQAKLSEKNEFVKYALIDQGAELRGKTVTLKLMWDHMPITGPMYFEHAKNATFKLPTKYKFNHHISADLYSADLYLINKLLTSLFAIVSSNSINPSLIVLSYRLLILGVGVATPLFTYAN